MCQIMYTNKCGPALQSERMEEKCSIIQAQWLLRKTDRGSDLDSYISSFRHGKCFYINLPLPIPGYIALYSNSVDFGMLSDLIIDFFLYQFTQQLCEATLLYTFTHHFIRYTLLVPSLTPFCQS